MTQYDCTFLPIVIAKRQITVPSWIYLKLNRILAVRSSQYENRDFRALTHVLQSKHSKNLSAFINKFDAFCANNVREIGLTVQIKQKYG